MNLFHYFSVTMEIWSRCLSNMFLWRFQNIWDVLMRRLCGQIRTVKSKSSNFDLANFRCFTTTRASTGSQSFLMCMLGSEGLQLKFTYFRCNFDFGIMGCEIPNKLWAISNICLMVVWPKNKRIQPGCVIKIEQNNTNVNLNGKYFPCRGRLKIVTSMEMLKWRVILFWSCWLANKVMSRWRVSAVIINMYVSLNVTELV